MDSSKNTSTTEQKGEAKKGPLPRATVLLVDDDLSIRKLQKMLLEPKRFRILEAEDGPSALSMIVQHHVDIIVLDVLMPGMTGLELLAELRKSPLTAQTPILLCTSVSDMDNVRQAANLGISGYFLKPIVARDFMWKVLKAEKEVIAVLEDPYYSLMKLGIKIKQFRELILVMINEAREKLAEIELDVAFGDCQPFEQLLRDLSASAENFGAKALKMTLDEAQKAVSSRSQAVKPFFPAIRIQLDRIEEAAELMIPQ